MIHDYKSFLARLKSIDWTWRTIDNYRDMYRMLESISEVIDYARRGNGKDPDGWHQKEYHDDIVGEVNVQFDNYEHDIKRATTQAHEQVTNEMFRGILDFGNAKINFYFATVASFEWHANRREVTTRGETMVTFVREVGGLIEEHWNRQCEIHECPLLRTGGKAGYITAKRHSY